MQAYKADAIVKNIVDVLFTRYGLNNSFLVLKCYDGESVMSGGVRAFNTNWRSTYAKHFRSVRGLSTLIPVILHRSSTTRIFITVKNFSPSTCYSLALIIDGISSNVCRHHIPYSWRKWWTTRNLKISKLTMLSKIVLRSMNTNKNIILSSNWFQSTKYAMRPFIPPTGLFMR